MTKRIFYIFISFLILGCSALRKTDSEKELEKSILVGDFLFGETGENLDSIPKKKKIIKDEPKFNQNINKDSLFNAVIKKVHPTKVKELTKAYNEGNNQEKEFLLMILSMNKSSKIEQINNLKTNENNIKTLIKEYSELVPDSLSVFIEFNPKDIVLSTNESVDLRIHSNRKNKNGGIELDFQEWNLPLNSEVLLEQINNLGWNKNTLSDIKKLLDNAKCCSIENGEISTVGFARSGMGKYSYKFFKNDLTKEEQSKFNDGCLYIYYDRNIVLEFGGGAVGQQCFEKE
ncbi:MAG: hypothetical protein CL624_08985 [Arcobacter sp.]|uniref:hypothetical protein n=1 Tax=Winogradskyella poriferorum TaxID=307627 RepID=UPI000C97F7E4|nr:hypothetical protein [Arcobacter sp.]|tara:strand:+ start:628 stop:1491 length:864 start_codon:yes stop_codon:yes gene_type:complete